LRVNSQPTAHCLGGLENLAWKEEAGEAETIKTENCIKMVKDKAIPALKRKGVYERTTF
jgi:hypothetical protein